MQQCVHIMPSIGWKASHEETQTPNITDYLLHLCSYVKHSEQLSQLSQKFVEIT